METKSHYDQHLSEYYSWIYGGLEIKIEDNLKFFLEHKIKPDLTKVALDLGSGSGFQSIPLSRIGFEVKAIDFSKNLLAELKQNSRNLKIELIEADMLNFSAYSKFHPELIVCMGDTLTHLESLAAVKALIKNSFKLLCKKGKLILSFRDLTNELKDEKRFIPIRSDENKIFMCFLENFPEYLKVFDIVYEKEANRWNQMISFYKKIKIAKDQIEKIIKNAGFKMEYFEYKNGMITVIAEKK